MKSLALTRRSTIKPSTTAAGNQLKFAWALITRRTAPGGTAAPSSTIAATTYSRGISYSPLGLIAQEQFGTDTAIYNKLAYNSRGQLAEIKESTTPNDSSWNRGKFINWYSLQCGVNVSSVDCNAADNNGNLRKQETFIPNNEQNTSSTSWYQQYEYDSLNRLTQAHEYASNNTLLWQQTYVYDRWGNRTINTNPSETYGGVNNLGFEV